MPLSENDHGYCAEYGRRLREMFPSQEWQELEPQLKDSWQNSGHKIQWAEAKWLVKAEWAGFLRE